MTRELQQQRRAARQFKAATVGRIPEKRAPESALHSPSMEALRRERNGWTDIYPEVAA